MHQLRYCQSQDDYCQSQDDYCHNACWHAERAPFIKRMHFRTRPEHRSG